MAGSSAIMPAPQEPVAPQPRTESKRERKRQILQERLQQMSDNFARTRDSAYREQLQRIQVDTSLIMRVDPYCERPLDALDLEHQQLAQNLNPDPAAPKSVLEMAGPKFYDWVHSIEDLVEERDFEIAKQKLEYERKCQGYRNVHAYKIQQAKREHHALSSTVRDRLINTITAKKFRLNKEKEALEISDSSALLLHPNQFSFANPSSPGGTHGKRSTRQRRDVEEIRGFDTSNTTPVWQSDRLRFGKTNGPAYSIDKLFTDKELSVTYNTSALAAHKYLLRHKSKTNGNGAASSPSESGSIDDHDDEDADSVPSAPVMERQVSHATRSTRGGAHNANFYDNKLIGLEGLVNFELPGNLERLDAQDPKLPPIVPAPYNKAKPMTEANGPPSLTHDDANADLMAMSILRQYEQIHGAGSNLDAPNGGRKVLEAVAAPTHESKYVAYLQGERPSADELRAELKVPLSNSRGEPGHAAPYTQPMIGAPPMSRQSSQGGVPMSRQGSHTRRRRG